MRAAVLCAALTTLTACAAGPEVTRVQGIDPQRQEMAVKTAEQMRAKGIRVWCVPFARNLSGIDIYGDARTWWKQAKSLFHQTNEPQIGSVMTFRATRSMPLGHVAVVSKVEGPRRIRVDHANWHRNRVSLDMAVIDVSEKNDWSRVRLESTPGRFGSVYPVQGFILPNGATAAKPAAKPGAKARVTRVSAESK